MVIPATEMPLSSMYVDDLNSNISQDVQFEFPEEVLMSTTDNHYTSLGYSPRPFKSNNLDTDNGAQQVTRRTNGDSKGDQTKRKERPKSAVDVTSKRKPQDAEVDMQSPSQVKRLSAKLEKLQSSNANGSSPPKTSPKTPSPTNQSDPTPGEEKTDQTPEDGKGEKGKKKNSVWYEYGCV